MVRKIFKEVHDPRMSKASSSKQLYGDLCMKMNNGQTVGNSLDRGTILNFTIKTTESSKVQYTKEGIMKRTSFFIFLAIMITLLSFSRVYSMPSYPISCNNCHLASGDPKPNDTTPPWVFDFTASEVSDSLTVTISTFDAVNEFRGVTVEEGMAFMVTETSSVPSASDSRWSLTPPADYTFDTDGTHTLYAWVKDGANNVSTNLVSVQVDIISSVSNQPPLAEAGAGQTVWVGDSVTLNGSGSSDMDGDTLDFSWSFVSLPAGSNAALDYPTDVSPTFDVDEPGTYVVQLIVNDGTVDSAPDTVTITTGNSAPVAEAGADQTASLGDGVTLDGSGSSDINGDTLAYQWSVNSIPAGSTAEISDPTVVAPTITADVSGDYIIQLVVNDGTLNSEPDTCAIHVPSVVDPPPPVGQGTCNDYRDNALEYRAKMREFRAKSPEFEEYRTLYREALKEYRNCRVQLRSEKLKEIREQIQLRSEKLKEIREEIQRRYNSLLQSRFSERSPAPIGDVAETDDRDNDGDQERDDD